MSHHYSYNASYSMESNAYPMQPGQGGYNEFAPEVSSSVTIFFELLIVFPGNLGCCCIVYRNASWILRVPRERVVKARIPWRKGLVLIWHCACHCGSDEF